MAAFVWNGATLSSYGEILEAAFTAEREGKAHEFRKAYRAVSEFADANLGYLIGYVEPPERRRQMYEAFQLNHPVFGGTP